jgi:hypothetical protein
MVGIIDAAVAHVVQARAGAFAPSSTFPFTDVSPVGAWGTSKLPACWQVSRHRPP